MYRHRVPRRGRRYDTAPLPTPYRLPQKWVTGSCVRAFYFLRHLPFMCITVKDGDIIEQNIKLSQIAIVHQPSKEEQRAKLFLTRSSLFFLNKKVVRPPEVATDVKVWIITWDAGDVTLSVGYGNGVASSFRMVFSHPKKSPTRLKKLSLQKNLRSLLN